MNAHLRLRPQPARAIRGDPNRVLLAMLLLVVAGGEPAAAVERMLPRDRPFDEARS